MSEPTREGYEQACVQMLAAAMAFREANPKAELVFHGLGAPVEAFVIAALEPALIRRVGGNKLTRELLRAMDAATGGKASIAQADAVLEQVYGVKRAIAGKPIRGRPAASSKPRGDAPDPERGEFAVAESHCPDCGGKLDCASTTDMRGKPGPGDFSVCIYCAAPLVFDEQLLLRHCTPAERAAGGAELERTIAVVRRHAEQRRRES